MDAIRREQIADLEFQIVGDYDDDSKWNGDAPFDFYHVVFNDKVLRGAPFDEEPNRVDIVAIAVANGISEAVAEMETNGWELCRVPGCTRLASVEVILYDVYFSSKNIIFEQDYTCPFLCFTHMEENEQKAVGERKPRAWVKYPYTNQGGRQGFTIYRPLNAE